VNEAVAFARAPSVLWRRVGAEVLLADPAGRDVERLSIPASASWLLLERPRPVAELTRLLADELSADASEIQERVTAIVDELRSHGWLVAADTDPGPG
jgi:hypothetical protein